MTDPTPLSAEELDEVRARNADVPWTASLVGNGGPTPEAAWQAIEDRARLLATLDARELDVERAWAKFRAIERAIQGPIEVATALPNQYHQAACATRSEGWVNKAGTPRCDCQLRDDLVHAFAALSETSHD